MVYNYIFTLILGWKVLFHPFYISLTDIRYNESSSTIEVAQKIFWDDLERGLGETFDTKIDFLNPKSPNKLKEMVEKYVIQHNEIIINEKKINLSFLGYEIEDEAVWIYLEGESSGIPKTVNIRNTILIDQFNDQQNIVNFYIGKKPKSMILYKDKTFGDLSF
ncbi:hypothetical protein MM213_11715 [Belliella sp. R4-6]|uniref:Uncharacterized protein n=1 Tax=Belliella alkalica TaxID=1730871 RepID=A0ABS9VE38_9BACT|nr:DUF6702 family protein [Belliella alkalica]MCH7414158.1 hypothetical protein [Belliella alkalica]